jgi:hypothetical protein
MRFRFAWSVATSTCWVALSSFCFSRKAPTRRVRASTIEKLIEDKVWRVVRAAELARHRGDSWGAKRRLETRLGAGWCAT